MKHIWLYGKSAHWYTHKNEDDIAFSIWHKYTTLTEWRSKEFIAPNAIPKILYKQILTADVRQSMFISREVKR